MTSPSEPPLAAEAAAAERAQSEERLDTALALATELAERAGAQGLPHPLGRARLVQAGIELRRFGLLPAYAAATDAQQLLEASGDLPRRLSAMNVCVSVLLFMGDYGRALEAVRRAVADSAAPGCGEVRLALLLSLAQLLARGGEYGAYVQVVHEALQLAQEEPALRSRVMEMTSRLTMARLDYAAWLDMHDRAGDAVAQRRAAETTLQSPDLSRWRSFSPSERMALRAQIWALGRLGHREQARAAAAVALRGARGPHRATLGTTYRALSSMHSDAGHAARALVYAQRTARLAQQLGDAGLLKDCQRDLLEMHEKLGHWRQCLDLLRVLGRNGYADRQRNNALRCRLAAMERQEERQRHQARQEQQHRQRLALIGRLIGQTHDALSAPIERVHGLVCQARDSRDPAQQLRRLGELNATIDGASALVSQLKLFSYRSSPQLMALSLRDALLQAWAGLAPHLGTRQVRLDAGAERDAPLAWADAQRLGILLKVLLIELIQRLGAAALQARVGACADDRVELVIDVPGPTPAPAGGAASFGLALCEEIAAEMGGALQALAGAGGALCTRLALRAAPDGPSQGAAP